jgi:phage-related protein
MSTFTWTPDFRAQKQSKPTVTPIKFGDGYEQRVSNGINTNSGTFSLQFSNREVAEIDAIEAFLDARAAVESFDYTPPRSATAIKVVCREWSRVTESATMDSLSAKFEQVFDP